MNPKFITVHCSATKPNANFSVDKLRKVHVDQYGWSDIGYHFYITVDGKVNPCRSLGRNGAHVRGHNTDNIGICLEGGINNDTGKPDNTFNHIQLDALRYLITELQDKYGISNEDVKGHRDWSPDLNGDGTIQASERIKECPCFEVKDFMKEEFNWHVH